MSACVRAWSQSVSQCLNDSSINALGEIHRKRQKQTYHLTQNKQNRTPPLLGTNINLCIPWLTDRHPPTHTHTYTHAHLPPRGFFEDGERPFTGNQVCCVYLGTPRQEPSGIYRPRAVTTMSEYVMTRCTDITLYDRSLEPNWPAIADGHVWRLREKSGRITPDCVSVALALHNLSNMTDVTNVTDVKVFLFYCWETKQTAQWLILLSW